MEKRFKVEFTKFAAKQLKRLPEYIRVEVYSWIRKVEYESVWIVRKVSGYHDEALQGHRFGQRSVRLNRSYRLIYKMENKEVVLITVLEVNKHKY